jgi:ATP-dependent protease Clp ATPase subunit
MMPENVLRLWKCSFCGLNNEQVEYIVVTNTPADPAICNDCIKAAQSVIDLYKEQKGKDNNENSATAEKGC